MIRFQEVTVSVGTVNLLNRLALARAFARHPKVLFLDEPTASLDSGSTKAIEDVIRAARSIVPT